MIREKAFLWNNGQFYYGQLLDGKLHGFGIYITNLAIIYGQFKQGLLNGYCRIQFEDHSYYSFFQEGQQNGVFKLVYCNEIYFKGINVRNDKTLIAQLDKTYFINQLKTQLKNWKEFENGTYFSEIVISKQRGGLGMMLDQNGRIEYGNFLNYQLDGVGGIVFDSGDRYHGDLKCGQLNGQGIFYNRVEKQFIYGRFKENQMVEIGKMCRDPINIRNQWNEKDGAKLVNDKELRMQIFGGRDEKVKLPIYFTPEKIRSISYNNKKLKYKEDSQCQSTFGEFEYHFSSNKLKNQVIEAHFSDKKQKQNYYSSIHQHKPQIIEEQIKQKIMKMFDQDRQVK